MKTFFSILLSLLFCTYLIGQQSSSEFRSTQSGSPADPKFTFSSDLNTGVFRAGTDQLGLSANGQTGLIVNGTSGTGRVGIGTNAPATKLHLNGQLRGHINGAVRINTGKGFIDVGPQSTSFAHITTDRPKFYFNKELRVNTGIIGSYDENLTLKTAGTTRMTLRSDNGRVGIGTASPAYTLHTKGAVYADGGWVRVSGNRGIFFQNHGGGFYMKDNTWIRTYNNKSFYHNSGIMRTDGDFQVGGNGARFRVKTDGKVGIGVTSPSTGLHIKANDSSYGQLLVEAKSTTDHAQMTLRSATSAKVSQFHFRNASNNKIWTLSSRWNHASGGNKFGLLHYNGSKWIAPLWVEPTGKMTLGIDGMDPSVKVIGGLCVSPTVAQACPDYVFEEDYELRSIEALEAYLKEHKHLPNVPSASEIEEQGGVNYIEMTYGMLEKLEEVTLYTIQQQKEIHELKNELDALKNNKMLKSKLFKSRK